jgi:phosphoglycolate phosphatase
MIERPLNTQNAMLSSFDAILFDFDGTLAVLNLDFALMRQRVLELAVARGVAADVLEGMYILEMIDHAVTLLQRQQDELASAFLRAAQQLLQDMELEAARASMLLPGVQELLDTLLQRQIGMGIVTRNCDAAVRVMFPEVDRYCRAFLPRDRVKLVKPDPGHLLEALDRLGSAPSRTLMVGDGVLDIQAGKALGMFSIGVLSGTGTRDRLLAQGADLVLDSVADLLAVIATAPEARP